jgi:hypothetical protein
MKSSLETLSLLPSILTKWVVWVTLSLGELALSSVIELSQVRIFSVPISFVQ